MRLLPRRRPHPRFAGFRRAARGAGRGWNRVETALLEWSEPAPIGGDRRRRLRLTLVVWFAAIALSFIGFGTSGEVYDIDRLGWGLMPFVGALAGLPFGLVLTRPTLGWLVSAGSALVLAVALPLRDTDPWSWTTLHSLVMFALLLSVSVRERLRRVLGVWAATVLLFAWGTQGDIRGGWIVGVSIITVVGLLLGRLAVTNRALSRQTEVSTAEKSRRLVLEERARIARDLHDIVAHHMSLVVVQAETAAYRIPDLPQSALTELDSISGSARAALAETRALLSVLRSADDDPLRTPQPGVEGLTDLIEGARRAGLHIDAEVHEVAGLRPGASLAAYRIVQESLANAARHAPGSAVRVLLTSNDQQVSLSVENGPDPSGTTGSASAGVVAPGHGIIGMRERAAAEGGTLEAGPEPSGGFAVRATLPLAPVVAVSA